MSASVTHRGVQIKCTGTSCSMSSDRTDFHTHIRMHPHTSASATCPPARPHKQCTSQLTQVQMPTCTHKNTTSTTAYTHTSTTAYSQRHHHYHCIHAHPSAYDCMCPSTHKKHKPTRPTAHSLTPGASPPASQPTHLDGVVLGHHRRLHALGVLHQRTLHLGRADAVAGHVDD